ncbi:hypothetical protein N9R79_12365 [Vibrio sp.]|nr:hypothetical protein [Vibrio sp.]
MFFSTLSHSNIGGSHICGELAVFLAENKKEFERKLIPELSHIDDMAHNVNGIEIKGVSYIDGDQYRLSYSFDWEIFLGCSGIQETGVERGSVLFTLDKKGIIEIDFPNYEARDTRDEF